MVCFVREEMTVGSVYDSRLAELVMGGEGVRWCKDKGKCTFQIPKERECNYDWVDGWGVGDLG